MHSQSPPTANFHVMAKPIGPICNLDCTYCYYLEKENLFPKGENFRMSPEVLEAYIREYIASQKTPEVTFAWQGGEPTLLGIDYFRHVVELQRKHSGGRKINNTLQTNGTRLNAEWCRFFLEHQFLIGLSIDGPRELHDAHRRNKGGKPTFDQVLRGLNLLKDYGVEFNTLTVVNRLNVECPLEVYDFLREVGSQYLQFIPLVERLPAATSVAGLTFAEPPEPGQPESAVTDWSVPSEAYGDFLIAIFDAWVRRDVGRVFVQMFDVSLGIWSGHGPGLCLFLPDCGEALAVEHNGDIYSCDHFVYPKYKLGNVMNESLSALVNSAQQREFGGAKSERLPKFCRDCEVRFACHGECPKHRFLTTPDGEPGLNYLCAGYKKFFRHIDPSMRRMTELLRARRAPAGIMTMLAQEEGRECPDSRGA
jgi:uncharacterized protein